MVHKKKKPPPSTYGSRIRSQDGPGWKSPAADGNFCPNRGLWDSFQMAGIYGLYMGGDPNWGSILQGTPRNNKTKRAVWWEFKI